MDKVDEKEIVKKVKKLVFPYIEEMKLSLVDVEYIQDGGHWYLRIFIENLNGDLDIEDCSNLSRKVEDKIENIIDERFFLEISSPGLERPLKKIEDYVRFKDSKVNLNLKHKFKEKRNFKATIKNVIDDKIFFEIGKEEVEIEFKEIRKANILFEFTDF